MSRPLTEFEPIAAAPLPVEAIAAEDTDISELLGRSVNPLVQAATPLLLLAVQLRHSAQLPEVARLREQVMAQIRRFEQRAQQGGAPVEAVTAARYVLCALLDEAVLNAPWGERSGWSQKTLLVVFHSESYGGAKFFQILERLCADVRRHLDLIELMYLCLALGFVGRYQIEAGGLARLGEIQDDLYRRIRAERGAAPDSLAPRWRGVEDRRRLGRFMPLWAAALLGLSVLVVAFVWFQTRLSTLAAPISAQAAQWGLAPATPPDATPLPPPPVRLKHLLAAPERDGLLSVDEQPDGQTRVRLSSAAMFASGGVDVEPDQRGLIAQIAAAIDQLPGRVIVVGHTDDVPVRSLRFADNYALSAARAQAVAQLLRAQLATPGRVEALGAGDSQPLARPPQLPANRARNRRVDILFQPGE
ncbi:type IVB secretion system protein IcmH/DotU [Xanthomonas cassavae CFBP 4642]|uniref:Type IVB secretion system protein IcmH/DotU n=1 Tax=Xanthomonas cassavae CFBP 4642 TaxID=1219375 RepID=A0ABS8HAP5_9XANT|nr:type IVB secretion system protein IcmH/DotU [Xanthomonas cassavae]MCC4619235.1 type IVB secretion system protein IcmH/DotU [Xanthomonas cassavae CFBP 4642]